MEQKLKTIFYAMGAMILAPQTLCAQSVNIEGLDSLRLSGSVSVVEPELLKKGVLNNALDALSGQTAGVNVTTNGLDRIAMLNSVRVRGTTSIMGGNDPLVIIDGVTSDVATLATIYPADIESFTVLKNASETALYGSRGASGVIQVKTKKGTGKGFQISYEGNYGIEAMYKSMEMLNAAEYIAAARSMGWSITIRDMIPISARRLPEPEISRTIIWPSAVALRRATTALLLAISTITRLFGARAIVIWWLRLMSPRRRLAIN